MAKYTLQSKELLAAIDAMGIETKDTQKIIIEIGVEAPVLVHVQSIGDEGLLGVVKAIGGDICVMREAPEKVTP